MDKIDYKRVSASLVAIALALVVYIADDMRNKIELLPEMQKEIALINRQMDHDRQAIKRIVMAIHRDLDELKDDRQYIITNEEIPAWGFLSPEPIQAVAPPFKREES